LSHNFIMNLNFIMLKTWLILLLIICSSYVTQIIVFSCVLYFKFKDTHTKICTRVGKNSSVYVYVIDESVEMCLIAHLLNEKISCFQTYLFRYMNCYLTLYIKWHMRERGSKIGEKCVTYYFNGSLNHERFARIGTCWLN